MEAGGDPSFDFHETKTTQFEEDYPSICGTRTARFELRTSKSVGRVLRESGGKDRGVNLRWPRYCEISKGRRE